MDHNLPGVYEYLFTNKTLLKEGDLSPEAARTLKRKIDDLSSLLGEDDLGEEKHTPPY
jgi:hypothetical protein